DESDGLSLLRPPAVGPSGAGAIGDEWPLAPEPQGLATFRSIRVIRGVTIRALGGSRAGPALRRATMPNLRFLLATLAALLASSLPCGARAEGWIVDGVGVAPAGSPQANP